MKTFAAFVAVGLIAVAQAQEQCAALAAKVPTCAVTCIASALPSTGCDETDFACQCEPAHQSALQSAAFGCVAKGCGAAQALQVQASASAVCACAASAAPASSTAAAPASTAAEATTTAATLATSTPIASSAPFPVSSGTASPSGVTAETAVGTGSGPVPSSTPVTFTGAAVKTVVSIGGVMGALLALIAAL